MKELHLMTGACPVVVLAAGASRRMGRLKPLLDFDGRTCLDLVLEACGGSGSRSVILVLGHEAGWICTNCRLGPEVLVALNDRPERGQMSSVQTGLRALTGMEEGFYIFPVDHPLVEARDLERLGEAFRGREAGKSIVIPTFEGRRGHPILLALEHREAIRTLSDETPLHGHIRIHEDQIVHVPVENEGVVMRMNTDEEYRRVLALYRSRKAGGAG